VKVALVASLSDCPSTLFERLRVVSAVLLAVLLAVLTTLTAVFNFIMKLSLKRMMMKLESLN
jgi:hypothetical protein